MKYMVMKPDGWSCKIEEYESGFFVYKDRLCFKSQYSTIKPFNSAGEFFVLEDVEIQPVIPVWEYD